MYKNFIFDLYGTLIDIHTDEQCDDTWNSFAKWLTERGMSYTGREAHALYDEGTAVLLAKPSPYKYVEIDVLPVFADICRRKRPECTDDEVWEAGEQFRKIATRRIKLYKNSRRVLDGLRMAGKKIYLLSNAQRVFTWQELELTGITDCFDGILISSDEGCMKPDPAFYRKLTDRYGLDISECIMIGNDSRADIAGAMSVGMDAAYLMTGGPYYDEPLPDPDSFTAHDSSAGLKRYVFEDGDIGHILELVGK